MPFLSKDTERGGEGERRGRREEERVAGERGAADRQRCRK